MVRTFLAAVLLTACATGDDGSVPVSHGCEGANGCARGQICRDGRCVQPDAATPDPDASGGDAGPELDEGTTDPDGGVLPVSDVAIADGPPADGPVRPDDSGDPDAALPGDMEVVAPDMAGGPCEAGTVRDCGRNVGLCRAGTQICSNEGQWGPCMGSIEPAAEICNGADDDCNGTIDDGFDIGGECDGLGQCGAGVVECRNPVATRCSTEPGGRDDESRGESCNDQDDDCDGNVDEGLGVGDACDGRCGPGEMECAPGGGLRCSTDPGGSESEPMAEVCDGRDNDCDQIIDEGFGLGDECDGIGTCGAGVRECDDEGGVRCSTDRGGANDEHGVETCDGEDEDCDGEVDEDFEVGEPCMGVAACGRGVTECSPEGEIRCSTDPGGTGDLGLELGAACPAEGRCPAGVLECSEADAVVCSTFPGGSDNRSAAEICNGEDDNCDGATDEGFDVGAECLAPGVCGVGLTECDDEGGARCDTAPGGSRQRASAEACNGLDDDCDGELDEGAACSGDTCETAPVLEPDAVGAGNTSRLEDDYSRSNCRAEAPGPDQLFRLDIPGAGNYAVAVAPLEDAYEPLFWVGGDCGTVENCAVASAGDADKGAGRPIGRAVAFPRADTFHLVVDSRVDQRGGAFVATARPFEDGERCANAIRLSPPARFAGITTGRDRDIAGTMCPAPVQTFGPDQAFRIDLDAPRRVRASVKPAANIDVVLYVVSSCGDVDGTCAGGANAGGAGVTEAVDVQLDAGTWYLVVDHAGNTGGPFLLDVE